MDPMQWIKEQSDDQPEITAATAMVNYCAICTSSDPLTADNLCVGCQAEVDRGYIIGMLAGRCVNGAERDKGKLRHARELTPNGASWEAMCGAKPGKRSAGWSSWPSTGEAVTCKRCEKRMNPNKFTTF